MPVEYVVTETHKGEYIRVHNHGKIMEKERCIWCRPEGLNSPIIIKDITEIRIGNTTIRFLTKNNMYHIINKYEINYMLVELTEDGLQL